MTDLGKGMGSEEKGKELVAPLPDDNMLSSSDLSPRFLLRSGLFAQKEETSPTSQVVDDKVADPIDGISKDSVSESSLEGSNDLSCESSLEGSNNFSSIKHENDGFRGCYSESLEKVDEDKEVSVWDGENSRYYDDRKVNTRPRAWLHYAKYKSSRNHLKAMAWMAAKERAESNVIANNGTSTVNRTTMTGGQEIYSGDEYESQKELSLIQRRNFKIKILVFCLLVALLAVCAATALALAKSSRDDIGGRDTDSIPTLSSTKHGEKNNLFTPSSAPPSVQSAPPTTAMNRVFVSTTLPPSVTEDPERRENATSASTQPTALSNRTTAPHVLPSAAPSHLFTNSLQTANPTTTTTPTIGTTMLVSQIPLSKSPSRFRGNQGNSSGVLPNDPFKVFESRQQLLTAVDAYLLDSSPLSDVAQIYGHEIGTWNVSLISNLNGIFDARRNVLAADFNEDIRSWDISSCTSTERMFRDARLFDQDLSLWKTDKVTSMSRMFRAAGSFRGEGLSNWVVSSVVDISFMFRNASSFRSDLSAWNVSRVLNAKYAFADATDFKMDLCSWGDRITRADGEVIKMKGMFANSGCIEAGDPVLSTNPRGPFCYSCT